MILKELGGRYKEKREAFCEEIHHSSSLIIADHSGRLPDLRITNTKQISTTNHLLAVNFVPVSTDICAGKAYSAVDCQIKAVFLQLFPEVCFGVVFRGFYIEVYCPKGDCLKTPSVKAELLSLNFKIYR